MIWNTAYIPMINGYGLFRPAYQQCDKISYRSADVAFFAVKENDKIILSVEDNGIGIPRSDLSVFSRKGLLDRTEGQFTVLRDWAVSL